MNLISRTHHLYERREHVFMVLREYTIISRGKVCVWNDTSIIGRKLDMNRHYHSDTIGLMLELFSSVCSWLVAVRDEFKTLSSKIIMLRLKKRSFVA